MNPSSLPHESYRRGAALFVAVLTISLTVSVLGLASLSLLRIEQRREVGQRDLLLARQHARSAVEFALISIANDANWRSTYPHGVESAPYAVGAGSNGTLSWIIQDSDGDLNNRDRLVQLLGIGRAGDALQVSSIQVSAEIGPEELRSMTITNDKKDDDVSTSKAWAQYLKPNLPANATYWRATGFEFYCKRTHNDDTVDIGLSYVSDDFATVTPLDQVNIISSSISDQWHWEVVQFAITETLEANQGIGISVTTQSSNKPIKIRYREKKVTEPNSALIRGSNAGWTSLAYDQALHYRVHGVYTTSSGKLKPLPGTWTWEAAP